MRYYKCRDCGIEQRHFQMTQVGVKGKYKPIYLCFDCWVKQEVKKEVYLKGITSNENIL